jgi:threonine dehydrogenase-like Zn-dependent dehydrogenase
VGIQRPGAFAEVVAVPEVNCHAIPQDLGFAVAALVEPLANAIRAVRLALRADPLPRRVAVIGAGALGYLTTFVLLRRSVPDVVVMDRSPARLANAAALGAHPELTTVDGEYDVIIDAVGSVETRELSVARLRPGGAAVWLGLHEPASGFDGLNLIRGERSVLGSFCYQDLDFRSAIALARDLPTELVASRPLAQGVEAFTDLLTDPPPTIKTLLLPRSDAVVGSLLAAETTGAVG